MKKKKICEIATLDENWPVGHMRRLSLVVRAERLDRRRGGDEAARGGGPHYKFNLTNGSENLETMEYMKCGRVYHDARHGVGSTGNIVRADPYSPANVPEYEGRLDPGEGQGNIEGRVKGKAKHRLLARQEVARHARFLSRSNRHVCASSISRAL